MDERLRFVARILEGEQMAPLCREFGISRVTGYKIFNRYKECGLDALNDRSRRPYRHANRLPFQVERCILGIKRDYPSWGAPKVRDKLIRQFPMIKAPAISTVHAALDRNGLVKRRKRRRYKAEGTELHAAQKPNGLWCADYKGEFMLGNRQYCYPLTITDYRSRYLLACEGMASTRSDFAFALFERVFKEFGLPAAIRTDNGAPFASGNALFGLSRLSVWWLRLGLQLERIKPANPQQNGRHERMHLTLKQEATKPASFNFLQQQERFDDFVRVYNNERPHQALGGACPGEIYTPSARVTVPLLEFVRLRLRDLVQHIERSKRAIVYSNFADELGTEKEHELPQVGEIDFVRFKQKARMFLKAHEDHIALHKLRQGKPLTPTDLAELEAMLLDAGIGDPETIERARQASEGFGRFLRSLVGLDRQAVSAAFSEFLADGSATAEQIEFIQMIVDHLTERGTMEPGLLYESPFTDIAPQGPENVFDMQRTDRLFQVIENINDSAVA